MNGYAIFFYIANDETNHETKIIIWISMLQFWICKPALFRGHYSPNQNLACFMLYLKIMNTLLKKKIYASYSKLAKELKTGTKIFVGQTILELLIKTLF